MPAQKDTVLGRLAVERGYLTPQQVDEALAAQKVGAEATGVTVSLSQVLVGKGMLTPDQVQELANAVAVQTGEARLIAGYEVVSKLGQGGMGAVYKARSLDTGRSVALKILPPSLADEDSVERFRRESKIVRELDHENIVGYVEFGYDERRKCHFCALELVEGEDLAKRIARLGRLPEAEAISIATQIAKALEGAYMNGLVHRDVKPENIMVTPDGKAMLLDLGLARQAKREATRLTRSGLFVGSPYYASPEQAVGDKDIDTRSDVYSLGATLYHMVTGRPPFEGPTPLAIVQRHVTEKAPCPAEDNPDLSDGLCALIARMMEKSPDDRYQTPEDVRRDLDLLAAGEEPDVTGKAVANSSVAVASAGLARPGGPASRPKVARERARRHRRPAEHRARDTTRERLRATGHVARRKPSRRSSLLTSISVAVAGALTLLVVVWLVVNGRKEPAPPLPKPETRRPPSRRVVTFPPPTPRKAEEPPKPLETGGMPLAPEPPAEPVATMEAEPFRDRDADEELFARIRRESDERMAKRDDPAPGAEAEFGGHRYRLYARRMAWHQAKRFCEEQGGHLVTITSAEENVFATSFARRREAQPGIWLGITDEGHDRRWEWVTGEEVTFQRWVRGDPSPGEIENCARLRADSRWADTRATVMLPFVCEWEEARPDAGPSEQAP